jgi:hypothetical protein
MYLDVIAPHLINESKPVMPDLSKKKRSERHGEFDGNVDKTRECGWSLIKLFHHKLITLQSNIIQAANIIYLML